MSKFGALSRLPIVVSLDYDPAADKVIGFYRAPVKMYIRSAYAIINTALNAGTENYYALNLVNAGTSGTATTPIGGTIGGTAGLTAAVAHSFSIPAAGVEVAAGSILALRYDETGTGTFGQVTIQVDATT